MEFIDSHAHPQFPQYDNDREEMIERNLREGIKMIAVGTDLKTSKDAIELAKKYKGIWVTIGVHPNDLEKYDGINEFEKLFDEERVVGIGEIGLDYYRTKGEEEQKRQREVLIEWLEIAKNKKIPLVIHCRDPLRRSSNEASAYDDMLQIIDSYFMIHNSDPKGVIHSFTSNWATAQKFIKRGFHIGLNGIITFTDQYNDVVENISLDDLLIETDAPYLSPKPHRGERNEPMRVKFVAEQIAKIKKLEVSEVAEATIKNTKKLFKL